MKKKIDDGAGCAKCGACMTVCPVFRVEGRESLTARGRMHLLSLHVGPPSAVFAEVFTRCLLCGACEQVCPRKLPITQLIAETRSHFSLLDGPASLHKAAACAVLSRPPLLAGLMKAGLSLKHLLALPADSGLRLRLNLLEEPNPPMPVNKTAPDGTISYFTGCFACYIQSSIATATIRLLNRCGLTAHLPADQCCCGLAAWSSGRKEQARELAQRNIEIFSGSGSILTSCASCSTHLLAYPTLFAENDPWHERAQTFAARVQEFCTFFKEQVPLPERDCTLRVFYHDPCHLRFQKNGMKTPRALLQKMGCTVLEREDGTHCCGQGGLFHLACPETTAKIFARCSRQVLALQPHCIVSTCSGCLIQYQHSLAVQGRKIRVAHLAVLLEEAYGGENCT